jgi:hypothetical protein
MLTWIAAGIAVYAFVRWMVEDRDHDQTAKAYLRVAAQLVRVTEERDGLAEECARLRRERPTVVRPAANVADRIRAANEAGRWDSEWEQFNGGDSA